MDAFETYYLSRYVGCLSSLLLNLIMSLLWPLSAFSINIFDQNIKIIIIKFHKFNMFFLIDLNIDEKMFHLIGFKIGETPNINLDKNYDKILSDICSCWQSLGYFSSCSSHLCI